MNKKINNVSDFPSIYYGIHFSEGCAQYQGKENSYKIFLNEDTIRKMDKSFAGKPVYVKHVDEVNLQNLQNEAAGYVVESFKNAADGKTWVKFIVITDEAKEKIKNGWRLSNSYIPKNFGPSGEWHAIPYEKEITDAEYEHLAIVDTPRYNESIILTPEEFKKYNEKKQEELKKIANSKGEKKMAFNFFKKTKVENSTDLEGMSVQLPKSKLEVPIAKLVNDADEAEMKKNDDKMADEKHHVMVGEEKMNVLDLVKKYQDCKNELEEMKKKDDDEDEDKKNEEEKEVEHKEDKKNDDEESEEDKDLDEEALKKEKEEEIAKKKNEKEKRFNEMANAHKVANTQERATLLTSMDRVAIGRAKYGSN